MTPTTPTLFTKPRCVQCDATKRKFAKHGIQITVVDITTDPDALDFLRSLDYAQAPVVWVSEDVHWSGYIPALIEQHLVEDVAA